jgi:hypothetical protein
LFHDYVTNDKAYIKRLRFYLDHGMRRRIQQTQIIFDRRKSDFSKPFQIETDASKRGVGGVLSQKVGKHFQPVAYFSKNLSRTESNSSTSTAAYVYGRDKRIITDHEPLKFLSTADVPSNRLGLQDSKRGFTYTILQLNIEQANSTATRMHYQGWRF